MGKVAMTYRLMPESADFSVSAAWNTIRSVLPAGSELKDSRVTPIAFGISAFDVMIVAEDAEGVSERIERALAAIPGIQSVESIETTLL